MNVITSAPMFLNKPVSSVGPSELYYGSNGDIMAKAKSGAKGTSTDRSGRVWDKTKGAWVKAKDSGLISSIQNLFGTQPPVDSSQYQTTYPDPNVKQPMSTGTKVLIGLGVAAVIGGIWYMATKGNKGNKGK